MSIDFQEANTKDLFSAFLSQRKQRDICIILSNIPLRIQAKEAQYTGIASTTHFTSTDLLAQESYKLICYTKYDFVFRF